jgi:SAM-dependent methyltransferase
MAFSIGVACVLTLEPTTCPYGAKQLLASREPWQTANSTTPPRWADLNATMQNGFTRCGKYANDTELFVDDSNEGAGTTYGYSREDVEALVTKAQGVVARHNYGKRPNDVHFLEALVGHVANGSSVLVIGSAEPWHEAVCLALGASRVTTVDYGSRTYEHPQLDQVNASFWNQLDDANLGYDVVVSASSLDHDGLGRYGDPIAPDGDLLTMRSLLRALAPGAKIILSVPVGPDRIIWNLMRIYGKDRLARLIDGYDVVERIGYDSTKLDEAPENVLRTYEPVLVLRVPDQICMNADFWCNFQKRTVFGHSAAIVVVVALMVLSFARSLRAGKYRAAGAELVINAIAVVTAPDYGVAVVIFSTLVHTYIHRAPRPKVVDFGRAPRLR